MTPPRSTPRIAAVTATAAATVLLGLAAAGPALALDKPTEPGELTLVDTPKGKALADKDGNPLYTRDADEADTPDCTGECATEWPAAIGYPTKADDVTGQTAQTEDDAQNADAPQVIYETRPLYYFKDDEQGQDPKGQDVEGWSLLSADGKSLGAGTGSDSDTGTGSDTDTDSTDPSASPETSSTSAEKSESPHSNMSPNASAMPTAPSMDSTDTTDSTKASPSTSPSMSTGTGTNIGALEATPSGAARGGATHATAEAEHPEAGPLTFASAAVTGAAAGIGVWLLRRRRTHSTGSGTGTGTGTRSGTDHH
ncbi:hypothetical protein [Streptomyces sp. KL118A]|uniref:hypothetical protein n=1 Tax=Streptomyces sp. KL118A TaxID=3045153 RepID=UPI00278C1CA7|nr:hypothetical protein [Streptomyces sp. KL118A]